MDIERVSPVAAYLQLAAILRAGIMDGTYPPGTLIPSIRQLVGLTGLAVMTVRHALAVLAEEDLVVISPGRGTYVNPDLRLER